MSQTTPMPTAEQDDTRTTAPGVGPVTLAALPLLLPTLAAAVAALAAVAIFAVLDATGEEQGLGEIFYVVIAIFVSAGVALAVTIGGLTVLARRLFLPGHRVAPVVLASIGPLLALAIFAVATFSASDFPSNVLFAVLALAALLSPSVAFLWCGSNGARRRVLLRGAAVLAVVGVVASLVLYAGWQAREGAVVADLPLGLFEGATADSPIPGWQHEPSETIDVRSKGGFAPEGHEAHLTYFAPTGIVYITMRTHIGDCSPDVVRRYTCEVVGNLPEGELRSYALVGDGVSFPPDSSEFLVVVYADGSGVSVSLDDIERDLGRDALAQLRRVDREQFEDATGSELALRL